MSALTAKSARAYARLAGFAYLVIFVLAIFANFAALGDLMVKGDPVATASRVRDALDLFRLGVAAFIVVLVADVLVSWALYLVLKPVQPALSLLAAMFRLVYTAMFAAVTLELLGILDVVQAGEAIATADAAQAIYLHLKAYGSGFAVSLIFFAVHLVLLGWLIARAAYLPTVIGVLLVCAGAGYGLDGFGRILFDGYGSLATVMMVVVVVPALVGEGALCLWLLIRGLNTNTWPEENGNCLDNK